MGKSTMANPKMILELCSYDDAASAVMAVIKSEAAQSAGEVFNVCDGQGLKVRDAFRCCQKVRLRHHCDDAKYPRKAFTAPHLGSCPIARVRFAGTPLAPPLLPPVLTASSPGVRVPGYAAARVQGGGRSGGDWQEI